MLLKFNSDVSLRNAVRREGHHTTDHTGVVSWSTRTAMDQNVVYTVYHMLATRVRSSESIPMLPNGLCSSYDTHNILITVSSHPSTAVHATAPSLQPQLRVIYVPRYLCLALLFTTMCVKLIYSLATYLYNVSVIAVASYST